MPFIKNNPLILGKALAPYDLADLARKDAEAFKRGLVDSIESGALSLRDCNLPALWANLADVQIPVSMPGPDGKMRTIQASAFPVLTGNVVVAAINAAYDEIPSITADLVEEFTDPKAVTVLGSVFALDSGVDEVKEGKDFPEISAAEETVHIPSKKNGRRLSITREAVEQNDLPNILSRVNELGRFARYWTERLTLYRLYDYYGSRSSPTAPYAYRPNWANTTLYSATANTPGTRAPSGNVIQNNALADETDLDAMWTRLRAMRDANGRPFDLPWTEVHFLLPTALEGTLLKLANSEDVPGVVGERSNYGPMGKRRIDPARIHTSAMVDAITSTCWLAGWFRRQFKRKMAQAVEYVTLGEQTESYLRADTVFQARVSWNVEVGAADYCLVVMNQAATAFPADE